MVHGSGDLRFAYGFKGFGLFSEVISNYFSKSEQRRGLFCGREALFVVFECLV